ncbi:MAG: GAF domain-containing protein, partial [Candidatus Zixiibacteriota bacterium]
LMPEVVRMTKGTEQIIVVDDEKGICQAIEALLTDEGYQVRAFMNPAEAAGVICSEKVDLVITDIKMPRMDGMQILETVKEIDEDIPVILMTGFASLDSAVAAVARKADRYFVKPVDFSELEQAVDEVLEKRRSGIERRQHLEQLKLANLILHRRINELNALYQAGKSIGSAADLNILLRQIVALASSVTEAQVGSIMLVDDRRQYLTIAAAIGLEHEIVTRTRLAIGESIAGHVAQTGEPLIIEDVEHDERFRRINQEKYGAASLLCAPLTIKNIVIGVINMANKLGGRAFTDIDLRLLTTFASQAAVAIDDANQFEENRRRLTEFEILHEVSSELPQIRSIHEFRGLLVEKLSRVFPIDYSLWFRWNNERKTLMPESAAGKTDLPLTDSGGIDVGRIGREDVSLKPVDPKNLDLNDISVFTTSISELLKQNATYPKPQQAYMAIPIIRHNEPAYVLYLGADCEKPYSDDDISLARLIVSQAALLFERERALLNATRLLTMGNMISEISHDLRKPLTSIKGSLQIIRQRWPELEGNDLFKLAEDEVYRMTELVRELVDFSNPNKYEAERIDLRQVVERASELVGPDLRKHKIEFSAAYADADWDVVVNKNQILEALLNLFINAVDAMPDGGKLSVTGVIERPESTRANYLALHISDTGCGIKKENLSRVFDRYYTSKPNGTGLGLAVAERIVAAHNGLVKVDSTEGKGTTFTVFLPYVKP